MNINESNNELPFESFELDFSGSMSEAYSSDTINRLERSLESNESDNSSQKTDSQEKINQQDHLQNEIPNESPEDILTAEILQYKEIQSMNNAVPNKKPRGRPKKILVNSENIPDTNTTIKEESQSRFKGKHQKTPVKIVDNTQAQVTPTQEEIQTETRQKPQEILINTIEEIENDIVPVQKESQSKPRGRPKKTPVKTVENIINNTPSSQEKLLNKPTNKLNKTPEIIQNTEIDINPLHEIFLESPKQTLITMTKVPETDITPIKDVRSKPRGRPKKTPVKTVESIEIDSMPSQQEVLNRFGEGIKVVLINTAEETTNDIFSTTQEAQSKPRGRPKKTPVKTTENTETSITPTKEELQVKAGGGNKKTPTKINKNTETGISSEEEPLVNSIEKLNETPKIVDSVEIDTTPFQEEFQNKSKGKTKIPSTKLLVSNKVDIAATQEKPLESLKETLINIGLGVETDITLIKDVQSKPRGRPKKTPVKTVESIEIDSMPSQEEVLNKFGEEPKEILINTAEETKNDTVSVIQEVQSKPRGRPKKTPVKTIESIEIDSTPSQEEVHSKSREKPKKSLVNVTKITETDTTSIHEPLLKNLEETLINIAEGVEADKTPSQVPNLKKSRGRPRKTPVKTKNESEDDISSDEQPLLKTLIETMQSGHRAESFEQKLNRNSSENSERESNNLIMEKKDVTQLSEEQFDRIIEEPLEEIQTGEVIKASNIPDLSNELLAENLEVKESENKSTESLGLLKDDDSTKNRTPLAAKRPRGRPRKMNSDLNPSETSASKPKSALRFTADTPKSARLNNKQTLLTFFTENLKKNNFSNEKKHKDKPKEKNEKSNLKKEASGQESIIKELEDMFGNSNENVESIFETIDTQHSPATPILEEDIFSFLETIKDSNMGEEGVDISKPPNDFITSRLVDVSEFDPQFSPNENASSSRKSDKTRLKPSSSGSKRLVSLNKNKNSSESVIPAKKSVGSLKTKLREKRTKNSLKSILKNSSKPVKRNKSSLGLGLSDSEDDPLIQKLETGLMSGTPFSRRGKSKIESIKFSFSEKPKKALNKSKGLRHSKSSTTNLIEDSTFVETNSVDADGNSIFIRTKSGINSKSLRQDENENSDDYVFSSSGSDDAFLDDLQSYPDDLLITPTKRTRSLSSQSTRRKMTCNQDNEIVLINNKPAIMLTDGRCIDSKYMMDIDPRLAVSNFYPLRYKKFKDSNGLKLGEFTIQVKGDVSQMRISENKQSWDIISSLLSRKITNENSKGDLNEDDSYIFSSDSYLEQKKQHSSFISPLFFQFSRIPIESIPDCVPKPDFILKLLIKCKDIRKVTGFVQENTSESEKEIGSDQNGEETKKKQNNKEPIELYRFEAVSSDKNQFQMGNTGISIFSLDWCPQTIGPVSYLSVSGMMDFEEPHFLWGNPTNKSSFISGNNCIQIWEHNIETGDLRCPLLIYHNRGPVIKLSWCPLRPADNAKDYEFLYNISKIFNYSNQSWENDPFLSNNSENPETFAFPTLDDIENVGGSKINKGSFSFYDENLYSHIGLLAVVFGDGTAGAFIVPRPSNVFDSGTTQEQSGSVNKDVVTPLVIKMPQLVIEMKMEKTTIKSLEWIGSDRIISFGYNGSVAIWSVSKILRQALKGYFDTEQVKSSDNKTESCLSLNTMGFPEIYSQAQPGYILCGTLYPPNLLGMVDLETKDKTSSKFYEEEQAIKSQSNGAIGTLSLNNLLFSTCSTMGYISTHTVDGPYFENNIFYKGSAWRGSMAWSQNGDVLFYIDYENTIRITPAIKIGGIKSTYEKLVRSIYVDQKLEKIMDTDLEDNIYMDNFDNLIVDVEQDTNDSESLGMKFLIPENNLSNAGEQKRQVAEEKLIFDDILTKLNASGKNLPYFLQMYENMVEQSDYLSVQEYLEADSVKNTKKSVRASKDVPWSTGNNITLDQLSSEVVSILESMKNAGVNGYEPDEPQEKNEKISGFVIYDHHANIWCITSSQCHEVVASTSSDGTLVVMETPHDLWAKNRNKRFMTPVCVYSVSLDNETGVYTIENKRNRRSRVFTINDYNKFFPPQVSIRTAAWHPAIGHARFIASGSSSGLLRIDKIE
ncbi:hypothetical protein BB559_005840 [Furculomyces boomerangus]|uniref:Uncharacterized protein n=1 Tax=Furculomyces boomerangus TaxID=61424 RepID=A0A2T9Y687_9FUNG|nr:hypothetical protein BB559_005840 [Furculomyces boomerangus]